MEVLSLLLKKKEEEKKKASAQWDSVGNNGRRVNMTVLVCLTRPGSSLLSFLLHSQ